MELEELKNKWRQLDKHVKAQDEKIRELTDQVIAGKVKSPLSTLRTHSIISVIVIPLLLPFFLVIFDFLGVSCPEWHEKLLYALTWVFVVSLFIRELIFIIDLKQINVARETALESLARTIKFRKHYQWGVLIELFIGMAFVIVMMSAFNREFLYGGILGFVIGVIFGGKLYNYYVNKIKELETALNEWTEE